ncbi:hypothetical protein ACWGOK_01340, partial [Streptomyces eurythermus]
MDKVRRAAWPGCNRLVVLGGVRLSGPGVPFLRLLRRPGVLLRDVEQQQPAVVGGDRQPLAVGRRGHLVDPAQLPAG